MYPHALTGHVRQDIRGTQTVTLYSRRLAGEGGGVLQWTNLGSAVDTLHSTPLQTDKAH